MYRPRQVRWRAPPGRIECRRCNDVALDVSGLRGAGVVDVKLRKRTLSLFFDSAGEAEEWEKHLSATIRNAQSLPAGLYERSFRSHEEKDKKRVLVIVAILVRCAEGLFARQLITSALSDHPYVVIGAGRFLTYTGESGTKSHFQVCTHEARLLVVWRSLT